MGLSEAQGPQLLGEWETNVRLAVWMTHRIGWRPQGDGWVQKNREVEHVRFQVMRGLTTNAVLHEAGYRMTGKKNVPLFEKDGSPKYAWHTLRSFGLFTRSDDALAYLVNVMTREEQKEYVETIIPLCESVVYPNDVQPLLPSIWLLQAPPDVKAVAASRIFRLTAADWKQQIEDAPFAGLLNSQWKDWLPKEDWSSAPLRPITDPARWDDEKEEEV